MASLCVGKSSCGSSKVLPLVYSPGNRCILEVPQRPRVKESWQGVLGRALLLLVRKRCRYAAGRSLCAPPLSPIKLHLMRTEQTDIEIQKTPL